MFPPEYDLRVADLNVAPLREEDLGWADVAFTSTMIVQRVSLEGVIRRCNRAGVPVVAGGPHPTTFHDEIEGVDHFVLDEVEETFARFSRTSRTAGPSRCTASLASRTSPAPRFPVSISST